MCFVCHVKKKNPNSVTWRPQPRHLEESGWEVQSPLNSLARFLARAGLLASCLGTLAADANGPCKCFA